MSRYRERERETMKEQGMRASVVAGSELREM